MKFLLAALPDTTAQLVFWGSVAIACFFIVVLLLAISRLSQRRVATPRSTLASLYREQPLPSASRMPAAPVAAPPEPEPEPEPEPKAETLPNRIILGDGDYNSSVRYLARHALKRVDLLDDLVANISQDAPGAAVAKQLEIFREDYLDLLSTQNIQLLLPEPGTPLSLGLRKMVVITATQREDAGSTARILEVLRPGFAIHDKVEDRLIVLRKVEVRVAEPKTAFQAHGELPTAFPEHDAVQV